MPQTDQACRDRWPGMDGQAIEYLESQGWRYSPKTWSWKRPSPDYEPNERELDAIKYLCEEWDWGGYE